MPRLIPTIGLVGAPLLAVSSIVTLLGGWSQTSTVAMLCTLPIATWELSVGVYMALKGFKTPSVDLGDTDDDVNRSVERVYA